MKANDSEKKKALEKVAKLKKIGFTILPADSPSEGKKGFVAIKNIAGKTYEEYISWNLFEGPTHTDEKYISSKEFMDLLDDPKWIASDDPKTLHVGVVHYDFTTNTITQRYYSLSEINQSSMKDEAYAKRAVVARRS